MAVLRFQEEVGVAGVHPDPVAVRAWLRGLPSSVSKSLGVSSTKAPLGDSTEAPRGRAPRAPQRLPNAALAWVRADLPALVRGCGGGGQLHELLAGP